MKISADASCASCPQNEVELTIFVGGNDKSGWRKKLTVRAEKLGSDKFFQIGLAAACMADFPGRIAPKSPQKYRPGSIRFQKNGFL